MTDRPIQCVDFTLRTEHDRVTIDGQTYTMPQLRAALAAHPAPAAQSEGEREDFAYLQRKLDKILSNVRIWDETGITKASVISEYVRDLQDEYTTPPADQQPGTAEGGAS